jgi:AGCS family alanine or glycine:cation symporter
MAYALFGSLAALGTGNMVQSNSVAHAIDAIIPVDPIWVGLSLALFAGAVILGGIRKIGRVAGVLVPLMALMYLAAGLGILGFHYDRLAGALHLILTSAFTGQAAVGGFIGASVSAAMQQGVARGVFSNEAGLGTLAIAAATAKVDYAAKQGCFAIVGVFISTMMVCTITGLVLAVTQMVGQENAQGVLLNGSALAVASFESVFSPLKYVVLGGSVLFAFTTILAWGYYGEQCIEYLFGPRVVLPYRWLYTGMIVVGALLKLEFVWAIADIANGFMAIPNLIAVVGLVRVVDKETQDYFKPGI